MDEDTNRIERGIRAERDRLGQNLDELEMKARQLVDWRTYYRNHPKLLLGIAVGGGLVLGSMAARGRGHRSASGEALEAPVRLRRPQSGLGRAMDDLWRGVTEALIGLASAKVIAVVSGAIPGFGEHYQPHRSAGLNGPARADVRRSG